MATLCLHCLRNLAFYRAGFQNGKLMRKDLFWINANGNFLDICVLEWCKLFGDSRGKHFWNKVVSEPKAFFHDLLKRLSMTELEFSAYIVTMREYRDRFVAHLDDDEMMHIPRLEVALKSASYLYDHIRTHENDGNVLVDAPLEAGAFYTRFHKAGKAAYQDAI